MVCKAQMVDVCEVVCHFHNVDLVLETIDAIRESRGYALAVTAFPNATRPKIMHILIELEMFHLPFEQFQQEICSPIASVVKRKGFKDD